MSDIAPRLPARPSLEQLRKQAKELLKECQAGEPSAVERFAKISSRTPCLADAQYIIAREYGFEDWTKLKEQVEIMRVSGPVFISSKSPFYTIDWQDKRINVEGPQMPEDWEAVCDVIKQYKLSKVTANGINDAALEHIAEHTHVTHLNISGAKDVTDSGIKHLGRMPQLQDLELGGGNSPVTDAGLEALEHLVELRRFQACWTPGISNAGIVGLTNSAHLEDVNLLGTPTGDGAIRALAGKPHLRRFKTGRQVTDAGLALLHQFPIFKTWSGGELTYGLMSADAGPNYLLIDGTFTDRGLADLAGLEGLFALNLFWHTPAFTSQGLASLKELSNLGFLGCQNNHCDDEAMRHIATFPSLRMLMGQGAVATDTGFEALSRSKSIEYIWGRECPNLTGRGFASLARMPALKGLAVSCKNVDDDALSTLPAFPSLREFMPMDVPDAGFRHIGRCENLEALWCMYCRDTGDEATANIAGLSNLKTYYAGKTNITDRSLEILGRMRSLERVELWQCAGLTGQGVSHLANLPNLREISLVGLPNITRQASAVFAPQVRVKYSL
jgi:hypothetical protein